MFSKSFYKWAETLGKLYIELPEEDQFGITFIDILGKEYTLTAWGRIEKFGVYLDNTLAFGENPDRTFDTEDELKDFIVQLEKNNAQLERLG